LTEVQNALGEYGCHNNLRRSYTNFCSADFQPVAVSFLNFRINAPHALLIAIVYLLGMATGGSLWALMRRAFAGARST
jgi:putative membrane protein